MEKGSIDNRRHKRIEVDSPSAFRVLVFNGAKFKVLSQKDFFGKIVNISTSGACITSSIALQQNSVLGLRFDLPGGTVTVMGKVVWASTEGSRFKAGIEFEDLSPDEFIKIDEFIG